MPETTTTSSASTHRIEKPAMSPARTQGTPPGLDPDYAAARATRLGASDVATILGLSRYQTPGTLWASKRGLITPPPDDPEGPAMLGRLIEPVIAQLYSNRTRATLLTGMTVVLDDWATCQVDRVATLDPQAGPQWIVECKHRDRWSAESQGWGADGSTDVPADVLVQVLVQQALTGLHETAHVAMLADREFRVLRVPFDSRLADAIMDRAHDWWARHLRDGHEPTATSPKDMEWIARQLRTLTDEPVEIADDDPRAVLLTTLADTTAACKEWEEAKELARVRVAEAMGDAKKWVSRWGSASFAYTTVQRTLDVEALIADLASRAHLTDDELAQLRLKHTRDGFGKRVLRWTPKRTTTPTPLTET
jgi:predicted phage-related endonuclease